MDIRRKSCKKSVIYDTDNLSNGTSFVSSYTMINANMFATTPFLPNVSLNVSLWSAFLSLDSILLQAIPFLFIQDSFLFGDFRVLFLLHI